MGRMGFYFDAVNCIGCRTCQIACKDKNALPVGMLFRRVVTVEAGRFPEGVILPHFRRLQSLRRPCVCEQLPFGSLREERAGTGNYR